MQEKEASQLANDKLSAEKSALSLKSDIEGQLKIVQGLEAKLANLESVEKIAAETKNNLDAKVHDLGIQKKENQRLSDDLASKSTKLVQVENELKEARLQITRSEDSIKGNFKMMLTAWKRIILTNLTIVRNSHI